MTRQRGMVGATCKSRHAYLIRILQEADQERAEEARPMNLGGLA
jgi:hypothetical protein